MLFQAGDFFEMHGSRRCKVIYATEEYFIACPVIQFVGSKELPCADINHPETYANTGNLEDFYWVKKIGAIECTQTRIKKLAAL